MLRASFLLLGSGRVAFYLAMSCRWRMWPPLERRLQRRQVVEVLDLEAEV